jgi:hypothetical protein
LLGQTEPTLTAGGRDIEIFVEIVVAKVRNAIAIADGDRGGDVRFFGEVDSSEDSMRRVVTLSGSPDPVPEMLRNEVMAPRYVGNHRTWCDRLGNDPPLLLIAPPSATDDARDFRPAPNNLRVVADVDHNVHTIRDPKRIAIMQARSALRYVRSELRLID